MPERETSRSKFPVFIMLTLVVVQMTGVAVLAYARFGDPRNMPDQLCRLALKVRNPRVPREVPYDWVRLCQAWDTWLPVLQREAPRLLETEGLWEPNDPLRAMIAEFLANAAELRPEILVPEAAMEKRLGVLAKSPPPAVMKQLLTPATMKKVNWSGRWLFVLNLQLGTWPEWKRMQILLGIMHRRGFTRAEAALRPRLPPVSGAPDYNTRTGTQYTLKAFNDISLDEQGLLRLVRRWSEFWRLAESMRASGDPELQARPDHILEQLSDQPTLADFADSLTNPLEEIRRSAKAAGLEIRPDTRMSAASIARDLFPIPIR